MQSRRKFIQQAALAAGAMMTPGLLMAEGFQSPDITKLTILHTNDVHSRLDPFPMDGGKNQGLGGVAARADLINSIRAKEQHVLLLDAGDIFQGTPYFNLYKGEPEMKAMAAMNYDAVTMGNHDFDAGLDNFANQLQFANFPVLLCNYDFNSTPMEFKSQPYKIFTKGKLKIGVTGIGIEMKGLVPDALYGNTKYLDPVANLNRTAEILKKQKGCDLVICLSHLGYKYGPAENKISDVLLARQTEYVDLIIGGHTHTFLDAPVTVKNINGADVLINQVGWAGIILGRLDFEFSKQKGKTLSTAHTVVVGQREGEL